MWLLAAPGLSLRPRSQRTYWKVRGRGLRIGQRVDVHLTSLRPESAINVSQTEVGYGD